MIFLRGARLGAEISNLFGKNWTESGSDWERGSDTVKDMIVARAKFFTGIWPRVSASDQAQNS